MAKMTEGGGGLKTPNFTWRHLWTLPKITHVNWACHKPKMVVFGIIAVRSKMNWTCHKPKIVICALQVQFTCNLTASRNKLIFWAYVKSSIHSVCLYVGNIRTYHDHPFIYILHNQNVGIELVFAPWVNLGSRRL